MFLMGCNFLKMIDDSRSSLLKLGKVGANLRKCLLENWGQVKRSLANDRGKSISSGSRSKFKAYDSGTKIKESNK